MNKELLLAILSMDAYNREYGASINITGSSVGNANIISRAELGIADPVCNNWQSAGFYAIAYDVTMVKDADGMRLLSDSDQVLSIRGTDRHFALSY